MADIVAQWIELKKQSKEVEEKLKALELLVLTEFRDDPRIKVVAGRKTVSITEEAYEKLESIGIQTKVVEQRRKDLEEFDIEVQTILLNNKNNYTEKISKESLRIK
jgi:hypothetical protein